MAKAPEDSLSLAERALFSMLRPLVRFWIRNAKTIQEFIDILKIVFVRIGIEELERTEAKVNISRISVVTGVHRPDVAKIFKHKGEPPRILPNVVPRIIGKWEADPDFTTSDGRPRVLSYKGDESEFADLVESVSKSVGVASALFEMERTGAVQYTSRGIRLKRATHRVTKDSAVVIETLAKDMQTLLDAVLQNKDAKQESPNLHIRTEYDNVVLSRLPQIRSWVKSEGRKFHRRVRNYIAKYDRDISGVAKGDAGGKVVVTAFSWIDPDDKS